MKFTTCISGVLSRRKQQSAFDQVSEFDRGRIVAYRDCGLSFRKVSSRNGRNQTTVMRICERWMQEVSARTIQRRLQQSGLSARHPLLGLPLTQSHRRLRRQWCDERRMWVAEWNEVVFTDESRICLQHHDGGIGYPSRTPPVRLAGNLNSQRYISEVLEPVVLPYLQGLATAIFQQDNARPHVARIVQRFFVNYQIELLPWPARSPDLSLIENMWSMVVQRLTQITSPAATPDQLWQRVEAAWSAVPQEHIQSLFESMSRRVAAVISNNGGYSGY
ncbi:transposable element Tcb1 transposase [Trichonephila clavipes]|nr:transposable element Tcb1 transposase [Trichonephila clavipes]